MKNNNQINELENLKKEKLKEIFKINVEPENKKYDFKKIIQFLKILFFIFFIVALFFFISNYIKYQNYIEASKETIELGEKYKKELQNKKLKEETEIKNLKNINLENIDKLSDEKKELMLNFIPSGKPLKREIKITSPFGMRIHPIKKIKKMHTGIDLKLMTGDPVIATAIGRVSFAGRKGGYGKVIIINHLSGFQTFFAHLDRIDIKVGDLVGKGKIIGGGGNTGYSTGSHLHYEIKYNGKFLNPKNFMDWNKKNFNIIFKKEKNIPWESFLTIVGKN